MNKPKTRPKLCPLLSAAPVELNADCMGDRCAWFHLVYHEDGDYTEGACALLRIADRLSNSQALTNLDKKTASEGGRKEAHE